MSSTPLSGRHVLADFRETLASSAVARHAVAFVLYLALTIVVFVPLVTQLDSAVLLEPGDMTSTARDYWAAEELGETPFTLEHDPLLFAPEGQSRSPSVQVANAVQPAFILLVEGVLGYLGGLNVYMLAGFVLSAFFMFALLDRLRLHVVASLFGGTVFGFSWWQLEQAYYGHVGLNQIWIFPLLLLGLLWLRRRRDFPAALAVGATLGLSFYLFSYLGLFACGLVFVFMVVDLLDQPRGRGRPLVLYGLVWTTTLAALFPALLGSVLLPSDFSNAFPTTKEHFFGARLVDYLIPSSHHPVLGGVASSLNAGRPHVGESVVFFGFAVLGLAAYTAARWRRSTAERTLSDDRAIALRCALVLVPFGALMSLPAYTTLEGRRVPLPDAAFVVGTFVNWWKIYARFGILLGVGVTILAAFALHLLLRHRRAVLLVPAILAATLFELYPHTPEKTVAVGDASPSVEWLAEQPAGTVAHYPMDLDWRARGVPGWGAYAWRTVYDQTVHGQPLYAVPSLRPDGSRREAIRLLSSDFARPLTPRVLRAQGVRYAVVHDDLYRAMGKPEPDPPKGLVLRARFDDVRIFGVEAEPTPDLERLMSLRAREIAAARGLGGSAGVEFTGGFHPGEPYHGFTGRWMTQGATLEVEGPNPGYNTKWLLVVRAFSNGTPRQLELVDDAGVVLGRVLVPPFEKVQILGSFTTGPEPERLQLRSSPGPTPLGGGDRRRASVFLAEVYTLPLPY